MKKPKPTEAMRRIARAVDDEWYQLINAMTNHNRNQWARQGYPGLKRRDVAGFAKAMPSMYAMLVRRLTGNVLSLSDRDDPPSGGERQGPG